MESVYNKKAVLSHGEPRSAAVNFEYAGTYRYRNVRWVYRPHTSDAYVCCAFWDDSI